MPTSVTGLTLCHSRPGNSLRVALSNTNSDALHLSRPRATRCYPRRLRRRSHTAMTAPAAKAACASLPQDYRHREVIDRYAPNQELLPARACKCTVNP
jgi:hypothetical protein